jgi:fructokinase
VTVCASAAGAEIWGRIVALGEVVADVYREETPSAVELSFTARPGGAPANVAVATSRLRSKASFIGSVGEDLFGDFILQALRIEGVDVSAVRRCEPPTRTSLAFVDVTASGDSSFTFYRSDPAADELLSPEDVSPEALSGASFVTFGSIPLRREPARSAVYRAVELAEELGVSIAFDVNLRQHLWDNVESAREAVYPLIEYSHIVKLSDDELEPLLDTTDAEEAARMLLERGVSLVFVTFGKSGAFYASQQFEGRVPTFEVKTVDPTGAGDAFLAASLVCLSEDTVWDETRVREAARYGAAAGALACTAYGAMQALPGRSELEQLIKAGASS